jgi:hypothetical protein
MNANMAAMLTKRLELLVCRAAISAAGRLDCLRE